ncbi:MAG: CoA transferase, partial [Gemmobacter sp.]
ADPQLAERDMIVTLTHPVMGPVRVVGSPLKMSETPAVPRGAPPLAGEHTDAVLGERLAMLPEAIADLRARRIV